MRRELGRRSTKAFAEIYFSHHFPLPFGEQHDDLFAVFDAGGGAKRVCRAEPRFHGKTTLAALIHPIRQFAYRWKRFCLMLGASMDAAEANLASIIEEVENNEALLEDFPHLRPAMDQKGQLVKWTDRQLVFRSGASIIAKGMGGRMRGLKRGAHRPDLAILDDPESPENSDTFKKRKRAKRWFGGTFLGLGGSDWDVYVIGNLVHHDSVIAELLRAPSWDSKLYRAENKPVRQGFRYPLGNTKTDGSPLWPEGWPPEKLLSYRNEPNVGSLVYAREMMNDPREDADKIFDTAQFEYFDFVKDRDLKTYDALATFIDPAGGQKPNELKQGKKDFAAIVTAGRGGGHIDVLDVKMTKKLPDSQFDLLLDTYEEFHASLIGAEENIFKNLIKSNIEAAGKARNLFPAIRPIHQTQNKVTRILSTQPLTENKTLRFARHLLQTVPEYFEQWDEFPAEHDDGPDATEGAVRLLEKPRWGAV